MKKYTLYIGLNDKDTKVQEIGLLDAYKVVSNIFTETCGFATIHEGRGVYTHNDGTPVQETTLIAFVNTDDNDSIMKAAGMIKTALNQESIMIEVSEVNAMFF